MHLKERDVEELYEFEAQGKAHRLWVEIALVAAADSHLKNSILDVWSIIMKKKKLSRQTCIRVDFSSPHMSIHTCWRMFNATLNLIKTQHYTSFHWTFTRFVFFPILRSEHFFFVVFQFADKTGNIIDNLMLPEKPITRYGNCDTLLVRTYS
ncbi:LOW QUALITY PROTEIN: hypothetical protein Cgig2_023121 [Carnegiea gigantea]|uniref:Uncharacterized protein n=1 Tax=Carnegiea gigantea TaxID=171969 RepID=A0A9Q1Q4Y8_9CARY|nr:LOW QUALITY PROTEIN: hypothetical protein Cgig2_023121 [Carnegiea gigantea]